MRFDDSSDLSDELKRLRAENYELREQQRLINERTSASQLIWYQNKSSVFRSLYKVDDSFDKIQLFVERSIGLDK